MNVKYGYNNIMVDGASYINEIRRDYSLYVLTNRAIISLCDGLKPAARRVIWTARNGKKYKSATLAGATMPIHPHAAPESTINTLAAPYGNNYCLLDGFGAFGTAIAPDAYGASRYTSVQLSKFTKDALMIDIDIIPMQDNYDSSLKEPVHFLPIVPIGLLNPSEGIAIGYSSTIVSRSLTDVINAQINHLSNQEIVNANPSFLPTNQIAVKNDTKWTYTGSIERINTTTVKITRLPFGVTHAKVVTNENSKLNKLLDDGIITDYTDSSKKDINVTVKLKRQTLAEYDDKKLLSLFGLINNVTENMTVLNLSHDAVLHLDFKQYIEQFTQWRLSWYVIRYQRLSNIIKEDLIALKDIIIAIDNNAGQIASTKQDKKDFCQWLGTIGIKNVDFIASMPTYRYTINERNRVEKTIQQQSNLLNEYQHILESDLKRKNIYKKELQSLLDKYGK